jgi:hypothetical protein
MNSLRRALNRKRLERQLRAEVEDHLERQISDNLRAGMSREEATRNALLRFGGLEQIKEACRDARGTRWLDTTHQDLKEEVIGDFSRSPCTCASDSVRECR